MVYISRMSMHQPPLLLITYSFSILLWLGSSSTSYGQCRYISTNEKLDATCPEYISECKDHMSESVSLSFALRPNKSGYLILSHKPFMGSDYHYGTYFGTSFLFLEDETIIKLIQRGNEWSVNGEFFVRYNLTTVEIQQLSKVNISSIRYTIDSNMNGTVELNNTECKRWSKYSGESITPKIDFPHLIAALLN
jgi:hypothetical protein